jgi:hypothetical protein
MHAAQHYLRPFGAQTIGDPVRIRHVMGQADDQRKVASLPIGDRLIGLIHKPDTKSIRSQGRDHGKADGWISEKGQFYAECRITGLGACRSGDEKQVGLLGVITFGWTA